MITISKRTLAALCLVCLMVGWYHAAPAPRPTPLEDRPVLKWIAKAAKQFLWIAVFVEPPPPAQPERHLARTQVGEDGYQQLEHARGW